MEFSKGKMKQLTSLLLLAALLVLGLIYSDRVFWGIGFVFGIAGPFVSGGVVKISDGKQHPVMWGNFSDDMVVMKW